MLSDAAIIRAAQLLTSQYDQDAVSRANERVAELLKHGNAEDAFVWRRIVAAVEELARNRRERENVS